MPSDESSYGSVYVIKSRQGEIYKVGFTRNWNRRSKQLEVGKKTDAIKVFFTRDPEDVEKRIHKYWDGMRLPQSEWFALSTKQVEELLSDIQSVSNSVEEEWHRKISQAKAYRQKEKERELNIKVSTDISFNSSISERQEAVRKSNNAERELQRWKRERELKKAKQEMQEGLVAMGMGVFILVFAALIIRAIEGN